MARKWGAGGLAKEQGPEPRTWARDDWRHDRGGRQRGGGRRRRGRAARGGGGDPAPSPAHPPPRLAQTPALPRLRPAAARPRGGGPAAHGVRAVAGLGAGDLTPGRAPAAGLRDHVADRVPARERLLRRLDACHAARPVAVAPVQDLPAEHRDRLAEPVCANVVRELLEFLVPD